MQHFSTHAKIAACSLVVVLSLLSLAAITRGNSNNLHPLYHQQHPSILSSAIFPPDPTKASTPCPRECVQHKSGLYLAVTSIGHGFPRVQFTCTGPHYPHATDSGCAEGRGDRTGSLPHSPQHVHDPADPTPEQTPTPPSSWLQHENEAADDDCPAGRSTRYTELHITAGNHNTFKDPDPEHDGQQHPTPTTVIDDSGLGFSDDATHHPVQHSSVFSPRERISRDSRVRSSPFTDGHWHRHSQETLQQDDIPIPLTTPEPAVSLPGPTPTANENIWSHDHHETSHEPDLAHESENTAGPASPTPEPLEAQPMTKVERTTSAERQHVPTVTEEKKKDKESGQVRKVLHRITTLIIETETVIAPPHPSSSFWSGRWLPKMFGSNSRDHDMFDACTEGEEHGRHRQHEEQEQHK